jgi:hypothetical protein
VKAIEAYKSSLKFEPTDWEPSSNICEANNLKTGYLLLTNAGAGDFADAIRGRFAEALRLNPKYAKARTPLTKIGEGRSWRGSSAAGTFGS